VHHVGSFVWSIHEARSEKHYVKEYLMSRQ